MYLLPPSTLALKAEEVNTFRGSFTVLLCCIVLLRPLDSTESVMHSWNYGNLFVNAQATTKQSQPNLD